MKTMFYLSIFLVAFFILLSFSMFQKEENDIPKNSQAVHALLDRAAIDLEKRYQMNAIGTLISMPGGPVCELGLSFNIQGPLQKAEIRKILVTGAQEFLNLINQDIVLKPYLKYDPFKINNIEITLFFKDPKGYTLTDPHISVAAISYGTLDYEKIIYTYDEELKCEIPSRKSRTFETYEEALAALHKENIPTDGEPQKILDFFRN